MEEIYGDQLAYGIREGERFTGEVLDNQTAAQLILAVFLNEPWAAVRKVRLFDEDYRRIFNRSINAHRLFLLSLIDRVVSRVRSDLQPELAASFASVRLTLAYLLRKILEETPEGQGLLEAPERWLPELTGQVEQALTDLARDIAQSINYYIDAKEDEEAEEGTGDTFDPKVLFKSKPGVTEVERDVLAHSRRQARRDENYLFRIAPLR